MKPVDQTSFGVPGGNCLSACVASILELPGEQVPYFMSEDPNGREWLKKLSHWLKQFDIYPLNIRNECYIPGIHILHGRSPRNIGTHAVVATGNTIIHDPHPSRAGIREVTERTILIPYNYEVKTS